MSFGPDPTRDEVGRLLGMLDRGETLGPGLERQRVDLKEEAGRRDRTGAVGPGSAHNESAARQLAGEAACMANTPGGGALIVGIADDGVLVGAATDVEWLRHRIYELTARALTVEVQAVTVRSTRLLVVIAPTAVEPIRWNGRIYWRVADNCVEVDPSTWHARRMSHLHYDWSSEESNVPGDQARPQALAVARDFLNETGARDLAASSDSQLLRRLNAVTGDDMLTNAGVLAFVGRGTPSLDYIHREHAGGDSTTRVRRADRSLLEELNEVFISLDAHNLVRHLQTGLAVGQIRDVPRLAAREAIVNGVAHREWGVPDPTVVEHVGRTLRVTSPGGFFGGVNEDNIITHPSQSRNQSLTQLLADLKIAEREGIGVDRMVREMVQVGHMPPDIREMTGPFVRASLVGDALDEGWIAWLGAIQPRSEPEDLNSLLLLRTLATRGWVDVARAAPVIQLTVEEARGALSKLASASISGHPMIVRVVGVPEGSEPAWKLSPGVLNVLMDAERDGDGHRALPGRSEIARSYAAARGRISTTELGSLVNAHGANLGTVLKELEQEGLLAPSSAARRGRGFFYRWVGDS